VDKKGVAILALIVALVAMGIGWFSSGSKPHENVPYDNTYEWTEIFHGYEAYLDRRISYSVISGTSMEPTFGEGDVILWVEVEGENLRGGDIIIYEHPTKPGYDNIVHRIIEVGTTYGNYRFIAKGDNLPEPDPNWIPEANVHGLVIGVIYAAEFHG